MNYEILSIDRLEEHEKLIKENGALREERNELERELQDANESITWWQNKYNALDKSNDIWLERINKALELLDSYKLGKYYYALTPAGLLEFEDILKGEDNE